MALSIKIVTTTRAAMAAFLAVAPLSACAADQIISPLDLPESADVADAPWPKLIDAPQPVSQTGENSVEVYSLRGAAIVESAQLEAEEMRRKAEEIQNRPVLRDNLAAVARKMRARAARADTLE
ncbi:MAG: hypothetical protein AAFQ73_12740 [Pseudomonadota bacterium]